MAYKKLTPEQIQAMLKMYDSGEITPVSLALIYEVHPTTIRRYLRLSGKELGRISHQVLLDDKTKISLRQVLSGFNITNPDILISELDKRFKIECRETEDDDEFFPIIKLG